MRRLVKTPVIAIVLLLLGGGVVAWRWRAGSEPEILFNTAAVKRGDLVATISATGTIEPVEVVDVGAQVAGLISAFGKDKFGNPIDYGSVVEEGTVLAKIDESVYAADLAVAKAQVEQNRAGELSAAANLQQMKARLIQAEAEWERAQELGRSKLLSLADYDSNKANFEIAKANVSVGDAALAQAKAATLQGQATLAKAQRNMDFCTIKSPVKGVIIDRRVNIGQTVVASLNAPSLFLIAKDLTRLQIWVAVNEADVGQIVSGAAVTFTCDAFPGREFTGTVNKVRLNATMTQNVVMYTVEVNTENPENILLPYLTANVRFVVRKESQALLVPNAALRWSPASTAQVSPDARSWKAAALEQGEPAAGSKTLKPGKGSKLIAGVVWLKDGEFVRPAEVKLGPTDGVATVVTSESLQEGQELVTGEIVQSVTAVRHNPFLPQIRKR